MDRSGSTMAAAVLGMTGALAGPVHGPQLATVDAAMSGRAAVTGMMSQRAALSGNDEPDPAEGSGTPPATPMSSQDAVPEVTFLVGSIVDQMEEERQEVMLEVATTPMSFQDAVPEVTFLVGSIVDEMEEERQEVKLEVRGDEKQPCIWRVHPRIRNTESDAYEPMLVSIGPLHHGKEGLHPMEEIKYRYLNKLLSRSPKSKLDRYIRVICDCEPRARKQYAEKLTLKADKFVKMLVLDGCFIIEYLVRREFNEAQELVLNDCFISENLVVQQPDQLVGVRWGFSHLRSDLMLLENQIPFFVLVKLFEESTIPLPGTHTEPLTLLGIALRFLEIELQQGRDLHENQVLHLLHLHHKCLDPTEILDKPRHLSCGQVALYPLKMSAHLISMLFFGVLYLVLIHKWPFHCFRRPTEESGVPNMIPCATELQESGVKFRKKQQVNSYLEVTFTTEGILEIPFLTIQESTSSKLRNFIALEQCCPQIGSHFTSYAVFMDNLINTPRDVTVLQKHGIIESKLGSDKEVAKLFNALFKGAQLDSNRHYNASLFKNVSKFCEVPHHKWRASLKNTHFNSPWTAIAFLIGMIIFGIAIAQAYFNISRRRLVTWNSELLYHGNQLLLRLLQRGLSTIYLSVLPSITSCYVSFRLVSGAPHTLVMVLRASVCTSLSLV